MDLDGDAALSLFGVAWAHLVILSRSQRVSFPTPIEGFCNSLSRDSFDDFRMNGIRMRVQNALVASGRRSQSLRASSDKNISPS